MMGEIAYVDDSQLNLDCIGTILEQDFKMATFNNADSFFSKLPQSNYTSILLDINMPVIDGFALYEMIMANPAYNGCPIFFISSDDSDASRIRSLKLGAVDFLSRHMGPAEMLARLKARIQFFKSHRSVVEFEGLKIDLTKLKTFLHGQEFQATFIELKLLTLIMTRYPEIISKEALIEYVWKSFVQDATVYTHISNLNAKLSNWAYEIQTIKGKGVQLVNKETPE